MGMPALITQTGTGTSAIWFPDWMQTPFSISFAVVPNAAASGVLQATYDNIDIANALATSQGFPNVTAASAVWFSIATLGAGVNASGIITAPVRALQLSITTAGATGIATATFIQATFPR